jgi:hypothetical protein
MSSRQTDPNPAASLVAEVDRIATVTKLTKRFLLFVVVPAVLIIVALLAVGVYSKREDITNIGTYLAGLGIFSFGLVVLGGVLVVLVSRLLETIEDEGPPRFERDWGVLGEGVQGWEVSRSLTYAILVLFVAGLLTMLISQFLQYEYEKKGEKQTAAGSSGKNEPVTPSDKEKEKNGKDGKDNKEIQPQSKDAESSPTKESPPKSDKPSRTPNAGTATETK